MFIEQISVFVENKFGRLAKIVELFSKNDINLGALSIADTTDFGILRIIVDKPDLALKVLKENQIDMIVLAGFMSILTEKFTKAYENRIINVHPALIPSFCGEGYYGLKVHEKALEYGVKVTGATVHFVNEIADGGKIIMQKAVDVKDGDTPEVLQKRVMVEAEWIILPQSTEYVASKISNGEIL